MPSYKASVAPLRIPRALRTPSSPITTSDGKTPAAANSPLPPGWSLNERDEIVNEEGLVMVDIQEEHPPDSEPTPSVKNSNGLVESSLGTLSERDPARLDEPSSHRLPQQISELLDALEVEEHEELKKAKELEEENTSDDETSDQSDFATPADVEDEIRNTLNLPNQNRGGGSGEDAEHLKSWGKTGLEGLKDIFKSSARKSVVSKEDASSGNQTAVPIEASSSHATTFKDNVRPPEPVTTSKAGKIQKKSVTFAPDTYSSRSISPSSVASSPVVPDHTPATGIMLPDIIERPIIPPKILTGPSPKSVPQRSEINGMNAHLNPRLASLLPRSYNRSCHDSNQSESCSSPQTEEPDEDLYESQEDCDSDEAGSSLWSEDEEDEGQEGSSWPYKNLDIQTALDLRQAALEYHTKRQGLGLGTGTGALGGDRAPADPDAEPEWVPLDSRIQAEGIPRQPGGPSRFKAGRTLNWDGKVQAGPTEERVVNGKLFGAVPIIEGPTPTQGGAVHQLPGRTTESTDMDEDLTAEELELLKSRLEILGMDQESRIAAEQAGSALMEWMEKARKGEVALQDEGDAESQAPAHQTLRTTTGMPKGLAREEGPPEIKTAPKSCSMFTKPTVSSTKDPGNGPPSKVPDPNGVLSDESTNTWKRATSVPDVDPTKPPAAKKLSRFKAQKLSRNDVY